jgi:hypothetical protein
MVCQGFSGRVSLVALRTIRELQDFSMRIRLSRRRLPLEQIYHVIEATGNSHANDSRTSQVYLKIKKSANPKISSFHPSPFSYSIIESFGHSFHTKLNLRMIY